MVCVGRALTTAASDLPSCQAKGSAKTPAGGGRTTPSFPSLGAVRTTVRGSAVNSTCVRGGVDVKPSADGTGWG
eukprot:1132633-Prorocentrum_minimum.AAC.1